ncbi:Protein of unknown function [Gryllus bimaculatus]|nr:Protein of unknown function [Gryllus bimaculatus]
MGGAQRGDAWRDVKRGGASPLELWKYAARSAGTDCRPPPTSPPLAPPAATPTLSQSQTMAGA